LPTFIGHAVTGIALSTTISNKQQWLRVGILTVFCSIAPDIDVISFRLGIPYQHWLGHRGLSHSIVFAALLGMIALLFISEKSIKRKCLCFCVFFASGILHDVLDAITNGGLGVAFFFPFSDTRYFLPWQPIEVAPLSIKRFLTLRGWEVIKSELLWVIIPSLCFMAIVALYRRKKKIIV
jgi:inner membrane protein